MIIRHDSSPFDADRNDDQITSSRGREEDKKNKGEMMKRFDRDHGDHCGRKLF